MSRFRLGDRVAGRVSTVPFTGTVASLTRHMIGVFTDEPVHCYGHLTRYVAVPPSMLTWKPR
jgi:hypothetical protein